MNTHFAKKFAWISSILIVSVMEAHACTCNIRPPVCYEYWRTDTIFLGTVTSVERAEGSPWQSVNMNVDENFRAMDFKTAQTFNYGHSCAHTFSKGGTYLFYGVRDEKKPNEFGPSLCTRTSDHTYDWFAEDLAFLKAVKEGKSLYWIWGTISEWGYDNPLSGIKAEVLGATPRKIGISNESGDIKFEVTKPGKYRVRVYLPAGRTDINGLIRNEEKLWEEQRKQIVGGRLRGKTSYVDYEVSVLANRCGWFDVSVPPK